MRCEGIEALTGKAVELQIAQGRIAGVKHIETSDPLPYLAAGFFDIQVNGYRGNGYSHENLSEETINNIIAALDASGTTHHLPTLVTLPAERLLDNLQTIARAVKRSEDIGSAIAGIHIEGPYISAEDGPRGAHDASYIRDPDFAEFCRWQEAAEGLIRLITLAPERRGAIDFIQKVTATGVVVAIGHSAAEAGLIGKAIEAGARMTTHLGNGSHNLLPRLKNYIWQQLADDRLAASIICDGFHLPPSVVKVFRRAKGLKRLILASDVAYFGGLRLPAFYLKDAEKFGVLAHVFPNIEKSLGSICVNDSDSVSVNFQRPELALEESLKRHIVLLTKAIGDPEWNRNELLREFKTNWNSIEPVHNTHLICSSGSDTLKKMQIYFPVKKHVFGISSCSIGIPESNSDLKNFLSYENRKKADGEGFVIPLIDLEPAPRNGEELPEWYLRAINNIPAKLQTEFTRHYSQLRAKYFWIVFNAPTPSGTTWFGLHLASKKKSLLPLKKERLGEWKIKRLSVDVLNKELLMPRSGANPSLFKKKVLLIGCGSVGSELAMKLGAAGLGEISMLDPDFLSLSNLYRHVLNKNFINAPKAKALDYKLSAHFPWINAQGDYGELLELRDFPEFFDQIDLIIIAIGSPTHERIFHDFLISKKIKTPVINTWLEGHGIGGHATLEISGTRGCLGCVYIDKATGRPGLSSSLNFFEQNQSIVKNYAGCTDMFIPYGAIHSTQTALIAADLAIRYLEGKISKSQKVSWKGSSEVAVQNGIQLSPRYDCFNQSLLPTPLYNPLCDRCRGVPAATYTDGGGLKVHIAQDIMDRWLNNRQTEPGSVESAGLLIGHSENENEIWIDGVTTPKKTDINKQNYFKLDDEAHSVELKYFFNESFQRRAYFGTWHTHPEDSPNPSQVDLDDWVVHVKENKDRPLFFIIIGRKVIKMFMLESGPLTELKRLDGE